MIPDLVCLNFDTCLATRYVCVGDGSPAAADVARFGEIKSLAQLETFRLYGRFAIPPVQAAQHD